MQKETKAYPHAHAQCCMHMLLSMRSSKWHRSKRTISLKKELRFFQLFRDQKKLRILRGDNMIDTWKKQQEKKGARRVHGDVERNICGCLLVCTRCTVTLKEESSSETTEKRKLGRKTLNLKKIKVFFIFSLWKKSWRVLFAFVLPLC